APSRRGGATSNSRHSSLSGRRCPSPMGAKVRKIARSPRSGRRTTSSIPFKRIGRAASNSLVVAIEPPHREAAAAREPAQGIGEPNRQAGDIIECEQVAVIGCNHQLALLARE